MSDPEDDREFLDDIKALEDVLANEQETPIVKYLEEDVSECNVVNNRRGYISSRGFGEVEGDEQNEDVRSEIDESQTAYETNKKLIELLKETRRELVTLLERCRENKAILDERIRMKAHVTKGSKILICTAGMPYFKDGKQYPAPWNNDVKKKQKNEELQVVHLRTTCPWTPKDRNILWRAIRHQAASEVLDREMADVDDISRENPDDLRDKQDPDEVSIVESNCRRLSKPLDLPKNFREMVGPLGSREFDWLKISVSDFDGRHTAEECKVMWQVFLHPDINRYKWTRDEDERLKTLVEKYQAENWTEIAVELNSRRSGYQCFLRFNTISHITPHADIGWSKIEDERLCRCVAKFKIGNYIPWGIVARYMHGRTKAQIYYRYMYNMAPNLKKGRFTREEDERLIEAVKKYGENFGQISYHCFSNRSCVQLNDHYQTLMVRKRGIRNAWSLNEDARLLFLYNEFGADWSKISRKMNGKTRTQVRHRHSAIVRYWDKGVSLYEIPRKYKQQITETPEVNVEDDDFIGSIEKNRVTKKDDAATSEMEVIDLELINYFQVMPPASRPGRKRKYYSKDELQDMTRKLCILLKCLSANLDVPEDLDETELTEKEKQLLKSLKDYQQMQLERANSRSVEYQYVGIDDINDIGKVHFSPVCSGNCNAGAKLRINKTLDYEPPARLDHCQMKLEMELETPENILEVVGKDINDDFEKISKIMNFAETNGRKSKFVTKIYVLGPEQISKILPNIFVEKLSRPTEIPPADAVPKKRSKKKEKPWNSSSSEGIIQRLDQPITCIEPNFHTLRALKHIMSKSETSGANTRSNQEAAHSSMSREAKTSMEKLKERLVQLFKYPIGLSHIIKPDDADGDTNSQWIDISAEDTNVDDDNECSIVSLPPNKKRRC